MGICFDLNETATLGETKRIYHKVTIYSSNLFSPVAFATDCNKLHPIQRHELNLVSIAKRKRLSKMSMTEQKIKRNELKTAINCLW